MRLPRRRRGAEPERPPLVARAAPDFAVEVRAPALVPGSDATVDVAPPLIELATVALAPVLDLVVSEPVDPSVEIETGALKPHVDVVPLALMDQALAIRSPRIELGPVQLVGVEMLAASAQGAALLVEPAVGSSSPQPLGERVLRATPPAQLPPGALRELLTRLWRSSGLRSPTELMLVGVYERAPGGAIHAVSVVDDRVLITLDPTGSARPATLVVGRRRSDGQPITVEAPPIGALGGA